MALSIFLLVLSAILFVSSLAQVLHTSPSRRSSMPINWTHYCITAEQGLRVYENGVELVGMADSVECWSPTKLKLQKPQPFLNRVLSQREIEYLYNSGFGSDSVMGSVA